MDLTELSRRPTSEEINAMPLRHYEGPVEVVRTPEAWERAEADMRADGILGFDTETRPTFRKGKLNAPSLIQIATAKTVYLVQLGWLPFGEACAKLLASPAIIKTGVSIGDDMLALARIHPFTPAGLVDLGQVARAHRLPNQGLRTLAASLFGWRISKGSQCSNWSLMDLSQRQIEYAATDAWIGRLIYLKLKELGLTDGSPNEPLATRKKRKGGA
ncbi:MULTISPECIES: 3'-5' exonuclease [unclassified Desulfovibrio]|uniref:3'-5' exonuclease n=1 Tax=unclassified Desulfovibrio TaxID=2593640 RepID=UPI0013EE35ED|nr:MULTISPECIES: 3'-5' exonuclease [unclassified Desulfovibrio]